MVAVLLPDERSDFVSTNRMGHMAGHTTNWPINRKTVSTISKSSQPYMTKIRMIFYDTMDVLCLINPLLHIGHNSARMAKISIFK